MIITLNPSIRATNEERPSRRFSGEFIQWLSALVRAFNGVADVGTLKRYAKANMTAAEVPSGWLICNGDAVSRSTYGDLFALIGTQWGAGDGSTTFNLPSMDATEETTVVKT